jgi:light-harvesting complex I chlorophyll a/b binding protein 1
VAKPPILVPIVLAVEFLAIACVKSKRKYPGGAFDTLGFSKDPKKLEEYKLKEVKNGK